MKIHLDITGKALAKPDFAMLRAGLAAVQASTPTATASDRANISTDPAEALMRMFGDRVSDAKDASALHGSFNPGSVPDENDDEMQK